MASDRRQRTRSFRLRFVVVAVACAVAACSSGVYHTVQRGENLYRIGKAYGVEYPELASANGIRPPYTIHVGQRIYIPGADRTLPVRIITPAAVARTTSKPRATSSARAAKTAPRPKAKSAPGM